MAKRLGGPLTVPVGDAVLGRLVDVTGAACDGGKALPADAPRRPIHRVPPALAVGQPSTAILSTGIKAIDLLTPIAHGGKAAMFGGAGRYEANGRPISLRNIRAPMFVVGTERDHIAPWRSVYKIHYLCDTDIAFVLTSGGHNAGIVSEPGHPHRNYRFKSAWAGDNRVGPDEWLASAEVREGSWWPAWSDWLAAHRSAKRVAPPRIGLPDAEGHVIADAPGTYVFQK